MYLANNFHHPKRIYSYTCTRSPHYVYCVGEIKQSFRYKNVCPFDSTVAAKY